MLACGLCCIEAAFAALIVLPLTPALTPVVLFLMPISANVTKWSPNDVICIPVVCSFQIICLGVIFGFLVFLFGLDIIFCIVFKIPSLLYTEWTNRREIALANS